jgi:phosphate transport system protein
MTVHFFREVEKLKSMILELSGRVERQLAEAVESVERRDAAQAARVLDLDHGIDRTEVAVEEECLKILALHQPVAHDLRFIVAVLKINSDVERIGDLAVNIAERAIFLADQPAVRAALDFQSMEAKAGGMLRDSLDALLRRDVRTAVRVRESDDEVDEMNRRIAALVKEQLRQLPEQVEPLIHMLAIARHLERIADHATNIAEDVIYMLKGEIVRHRYERYDAEGTEPAGG